MFHLHPAFAFYSVFVGEGHLPNLVTWHQVVRPTFIGESREFMGRQPFNTLIFGFDCLVRNPMAVNPFRSHCPRQGCASCK